MRLPLRRTCERSRSPPCQNDARLTLPFRLCLARHRVFQRGGDDHVADLDRLHLNTPVRHFLLERNLEPVAELDPGLNQLRQIVLADGIPKLSLRERITASS